MTELDTSKNAVMPIEAGSIYNAILRQITSEEYDDPIDGCHVVETHYPDLGADINMGIRIFKDIQGTQEERRTNLYVLVGEFPDTEEIKIQNDDISQVEALIIDGCLKRTIINGKACESLKDLEPYMGINPVSGKPEEHRNCVMSAVSLQADLIAKYDTLLQTEFAK